MDIFIFDVDGTLTPSRQTIDSDFASFFKKFCRENSVYLITGSDRNKTIEQVGREIYNLAKSIQQTVFNKFKIDLEIEVNII